MELISVTPTRCAMKLGCGDAPSLEMKQDPMQNDNKRQEG